MGGGRGREREISIGVFFVTITGRRPTKSASRGGGRRHTAAAPCTPQKIRRQQQQQQQQAHARTSSAAATLALRPAGSRGTSTVNATESTRFLERERLVTALFVGDGGVLYVKA